MKIEHVKLGVRYVIVSVLLYGGWYVISPEYIDTFEENQAGVIQVSIGAVAASLSVVLTAIFATEIRK